MSESRYSNTSFNNKQRRTTPTVKNIFAGTIYGVSGDINSSYVLTASSQDIALAPSGLFLEQGGLSQDGMFSPFQIGTNSTGLPVMPTSASTNCVPSQSNIVDPPVNEWTPPIVNISYLNPFKRPSDPSHGSASHYDGNIVFNGGTSDGQNLVNEVYLRSGSFPDNLRPIAMRGPIVIQGWGYDLDGKPIPNKADSAGNARQGTFVSSALEDEFLDDWIQKRETWPVAPLDVRYDRQRKVWTVPNTFRIIKAQASASISAGSSGTATPVNINTVYDSAGSTVSTPTINVDNPSFGSDIAAGEQFFAFYDTRDCVYYAIKASGSGGGGGGGNTTQIAANTYCGGEGNSIADTQLDLITFEDGFYVEADAGTNAYIVRNDLRFSGNRFYNIVPRSGLSVEAFGSCNYYLDASGTVVSVSATNGCSTTAAVTNEATDKASYGDGLEVSVAGKTATVNTVHKLNGSTFSNITLGSGLQATAGANCSYTIDNTYCPPVVEVQGDLSLITVVDGTCKTYQISGCFPDLQVGKVGSTTVTSSTSAGCTTYTVSGDCLPEINVGTNGSTTVSKSTSAGCDTYTISGACLPELQVGKVGSTTVSKSTSAGCDTYTVSGDCLPVVQGAGGVSVSSSVSAGCTTYTVSGCDVNITAGTGITVVESAGGCSFEINADQACYPEVTVSDTCLILNTNTLGCKTTYDIDIDDSCKTGFEAPNWSLCGTPVNKDDNITFTASGCIEIDCAAGDVEIGVPCTQISGGDCISVTTNGTNDFTVSLASTGTAGSIQVVKDICCSGSGLNVVYTTLNFNSCGLFTGVSDVGSC